MISRKIFIFLLVVIITICSLLKYKITKESYGNIVDAEACITELQKVKSDLSKNKGEIARKNTETLEKDAMIQQQLSLCDSTTSSLTKQLNECNSNLSSEKLASTNVQSQSVSLKKDNDKYLNCCTSMTSKNEELSKIISKQKNDFDQCTINSSSLEKTNTDLLNQLEVIKKNMNDCNKRYAELQQKTKNMNI